MREVPIDPPRHGDRSQPGLKISETHGSRFAIATRNQTPRTRPARKIRDGDSKPNSAGGTAIPEDEVAIADGDLR